MSWGGGASKNNVTPVSRGDQAWDPANPAASVQAACRRVESLATSKVITANPGKATGVSFTL